MAFEHLGYFEDLMVRMEDGVPPKYLGFKLQTENKEDRKLGYAGSKDKVITEPILLQKGHREVRYSASAKKPLRVTTMLQRLEGRQV